MLDCNKFTDIDFIKHIDQIQGGCVIVENVNTEFEKIRNQVKILQSYDCLVILEVSDVEIEKGLKDLSIDGIKEFIHMCSMEADELMAFAEEYVKEKEYFIEEQAKEFLLNYIEELIRECDSSALCKALEKISKAYHCANERNKVELRHIAESGNFKDAILMSINYKDFACEI